MIPKVMVIATAAAAAVVIAFFNDQTQQIQRTTHAAAARADLRPLTPGDIIHVESVDFIEHPGRYGLGTNLPGSRYAIVDGHLVRVDPDTMQLQSILRLDSAVE